jgi:hypothetical protein
MEPEASFQADGAGYSAAEVVAAAFATLFLTPFALIAALLLQNGQTDPRKRSQLRMWAWISGGLFALEVAWLLLQTLGSGSA